ncbi:MAG: membrane protease subunit [Candidatus Berkelbacteria bacterium]|nr:membrane protease subunit [Candidatus Berkelbacteria bacterium]
MEETKVNTTKVILWSVVIGSVVILGLYLLVYFALPWGSLQSAHYHRRVQVVDAEGKRDAAIALAEAEVHRAEGVARANLIIANSITEPYLRYLFIQNVAGTANKEVIYVPTEATLPILEAQRLK